MRDFSNIFHESITFGGHLLISAATVAIIWLAVLTYKSKSILTTERVTIFNAENNHHVYAEYGDLFANNGSSKNVVITANRCFDTIVDNDLISETTIHGLAINQICTNGYTPEMLKERTKIYIVLLLIVPNGISHAFQFVDSTNDCIEHTDLI